MWHFSLYIYTVDYVSHDLFIFISFNTYLRFQSKANWLNYPSLSSKCECFLSKESLTCIIFPSLGKVSHCVLICVLIWPQTSCLSPDGWMICDFTSLLTVFQSYQDDGWVIMKGCVQWNPVYDWRNPCLRRGSNPGPLDQQTKAGRWATEAWARRRHSLLFEMRKYLITRFWACLCPVLVPGIE